MFYKLWVQSMCSGLNHTFGIFHCPLYTSIFFSADSSTLWNVSAKQPKVICSGVIGVEKPNCGSQPMGPASTLETQVQPLSPVQGWGPSQVSLPVGRWGQQIGYCRGHGAMGRLC